MVYKQRYSIEFFLTLRKVKLMVHSIVAHQIFYYCSNVHVNNIKRTEKNSKIEMKLNQFEKERKERK